MIGFWSTVPLHVSGRTGLLMFHRTTGRDVFFAKAAEFFLGHRHGAFRFWLPRQLGDDDIQTCVDAS